MPPHDRLNDISFLIIEAAIEVHRTRGPGLLERIYRLCLIHEIRARGLTVAAEQVVPLRYKELMFDAAYRVDAVLFAAREQPLGLLINFNVPVLVKGVRRIMNGARDAALNSRTLPGSGPPSRTP